jgi:hypothetical protein
MEASPATIDGTNWVPDWVVVTFRDDMPLLRLQLRSLLRFCTAADIASCRVIVNEPAAVAEVLCAEVRGWVGNSWLSERLIVAPAAEWIADDFELRGWRRQQALKLSACEASNAPFILVMDAKNHLVDRFDVDFLHDARGRLLSAFRIKSGDQREWLADSLRMFGVDGIDLDTFRSPPTTTPYALSPGELRQLREALLPNGADWLDFFRRTDHRATEFFLYAAWILRRYGAFDGHFVERGGPWNVTLFGRYPDTPEQIDACVQRLRSGRVRFLGLHRARLPYVLGDARLYQELRGLWIRSGLFQNETEIAAFFSPEVGAANG